MAKQTSFVKSGFSETPVANTRLDIMGVLERYGATGFGYDAVGDDIVVRFTVPGAHGSPLRVAYPVNIARIQERLAPYFKQMKKGAPTREQAERVAWRNVYLLVDAAFAAASIGASTIEEAFHAHILVRSTDGAEGRLYDYVETLRVAAGGTLPGADALRALPRGRS